MDTKTSKDEQVDINFESHPPIIDDITGVSTLLRQNLFQFVDCHALASYLVDLKDITQVIAQEAPDEDFSGDEEDSDDDIYGVVSVIDLQTGLSSKADSVGKITDEAHKRYLGAIRQMKKFLKDKCPELKESLTDDNTTKNLKYGVVVNERFINLPPQLALPTLKVLTKSLDEAKYSHLIFISKILVKARSTELNLPSKKIKSSNNGRHQPSASSACPKKSSSVHEMLVYVNPEEEIIFENSDYHTDIDVSAYCDENATWSFSSDIKYIPHRRIMVIDYNKWPTILKALEEELKQ